MLNILNGFYRLSSNKLVVTINHPPYFRVPDHDGVCPATLTGMAIDIAEGLAYLHRKNLIHRDIACRNCLVGSDGVVKIGDFGLTREMNSSENEGYYRFTRNCKYWNNSSFVYILLFILLKIFMYNLCVISVFCCQTK